VDTVYSVYEIKTASPPNGGLKY